MFLDELPVPALERVLHHLNFIDLLRVRRVCRRLHQDQQSTCSFGLCISTLNHPPHIRSIDFGSHSLPPSHVYRLRFWFLPNWPNRVDLFTLGFVQSARRLYLYSHHPHQFASTSVQLVRFLSRPDRVALQAFHLHGFFDEIQLNKVLEALFKHHGHSLRFLAIFRSNSLIQTCAGSHHPCLSRLPALEQLHSDVGWTVTLSQTHDSLRTVHLPLGHFRLQCRPRHLLSIQTDFGPQMPSFRYVRVLKLHYFSCDLFDSLLAYLSVDGDELQHLQQFILRFSGSQRDDLELLPTLTDFLCKCRQLQELAIYDLLLDDKRTNSLLNSLLTSRLQHSLRKLLLRSTRILISSAAFDWSPLLNRFERLEAIELHPLDMITSQTVLGTFVDRANRASNSSFQVTLLPLPDSSVTMPSNLTLIQPSFKFNMW
jgi:hypothetical protein